MRKASTLSDERPDEDPQVASQKDSTPYHLRFVDPSRVTTPVNDDDDASYEDDGDAGNKSYRHVDVDDLLSTPRYVDAKALKKSTQAEIKRIERERLGDQFASYAKPAEAGRKTRSGLYWSTISFCAVLCMGLAIGFALYPDELGRIPETIRNAVSNSENLGSVKAGNEPANGISAAQGPSAQTQSTVPSVTSPRAPSVNAQAQVTPSAPQIRPQAAQQTAAAPPVSGTSPLAKSLFELGALSCIARANQISNFLSNGSEAIVLQKPISNPDKSLLMATMLPISPDKSENLSIVTLSPNQANGCDGNYQSIRVIEKPCPAAINEMFGAGKALNAGTSGISIVPLNQFGRVFTIPAGNTCVMIKQELVQ